MFNWLRKSMLPECFYCLLLVFCLLASPLYAKDKVLTDPTRPADLSAPIHIETDGQEGSYKLSQIYRNNKGRMAIVNGQRVRVGDFLDNTSESAELVGISQNSVSLRLNSGIKILTIAPIIKIYHH